FDDVDCQGGNGFLPVSVLGNTYKDCIFIVCDGLDADPRRHKYPLSCDNGYQVSTHLNDITKRDIFFPNACKGLTVPDCLAIYFYTYFCVIETSTTDNIACGPTFQELKGEGTYDQDSVDECIAKLEIQRNIEQDNLTKTFDRLIGEC
ncbi:unnamed protein product, partial [Owenia fusiformis]